MTDCVLFDVYAHGLFITISVQPVNVCCGHKGLVEGFISQSSPEVLIGKYDFLEVLSN